MNIAKLQILAGKRLGLRPAATRRNSSGGHLEEVDDDWIVDSVNPHTGIKITNARTGHSLTLNQDHIHHFHSAPATPNSSRFGWLEITLRLEMKDESIAAEPILGGAAKLPRTIVSKDPPDPTQGRDGDIWYQYQ